MHYLMQRLQKREGWLARYKDPLLMRQAEEIQPLAIPAKQYFKSDTFPLQPYLKEIFINKNTGNKKGEDDGIGRCEWVLELKTLKDTIGQVKRWKNSFAARK